jgi:hypothetical protein
VTPRLTLNLGVRYDREELVNNCCWDASRTYKILKDIGHPYGKLPQTDTNNIAPRLGVAADVTGDGRNVLRSSFGMFYGTGIITSAYCSNLEQQETVFVRSTVANSAIGSGQLANYVYGVSPLPAAPSVARRSSSPGATRKGRGTRPISRIP